MKPILFAIAAALPFACIAAPNDAANTFMHRLNDVASNCQTIGFHIAVDQDMIAQHHRRQAALNNKPAEVREDSDALIAQDKPFVDCVVAARDVGAKLYKDFIATTTDPKIREDASKVLAAWLPYVDSLNISKDSIQSGNAQATAADQAESKMLTDML
jgi:hypothetical protein